MAKGETPRPVGRTNYFHDALMFKLSRFNELLVAALITLATVVHANDYDIAAKALQNRDYTNAMRAFRKAAVAGSAAAERNLGFMHYRGLGVPENIKVAEEWFLKAAEHGDLQSQVNLGTMYENGLSVVKDEARSAFWFKRAAEQGHRPSQMRIGEILFVGQGVPSDYVEADKWWRVAMSGANDDYSAWMRPIVERAELKMTAEQLLEAEQRAKSWKASPTAR